MRPPVASLIASALLLALLPVLAAASTARQDGGSSGRRSIPEWDGRVVIRLNGGVSFPIGNFGDRFETGFGAGGSVGYGVSKSVLVSWGAAIHSFDHETIENLEVRVIPITLGADYRIHTGGRVTPWVGGGLGIYQVEQDLPAPAEDTDENNFGLNFGGGIALPIGERAALGTGIKFHYVAGDQFIDTPFFTYQVGVGFIL